MVKQILIGLYDNIYDITKYIPKHPGEGIKFVNLREYAGKDASSDFDKQHLTNEPDEILISAQENGYDEESGIYYVFPFFFKKKIPKYFKFLAEDPYAKKYFENKDNKTFILRRSNSDVKTSLSVTYKDEEGEINQLKIRLTDNVWFTTFENEDGEPEDYESKDIEEIIQQIFLDNGFNF